jgi:hypothetical protein
MIYKLVAIFLISYVFFLVFLFRPVKQVSDKINPLQKVVLGDEPVFRSYRGGERGVTMLIAVLSARNNFGRRKLARSTWIKTLREKSTGADDVVFVLGQRICFPHCRTQSIETKRIATEQEKYSDILLLPVADKYKSSAKKMLLFYVWVSQNIPQKYFCILKLDDDTLPNINLIRQRLVSFRLQNVIQRSMRWWWGDFRLQRVERDPSSPWYLGNMKNKVFLFSDNDALPFFASGWGHAMSISLVLDIAHYSSLLKMEVWMEDAALGIWFDQLSSNSTNYVRIFDSTWGVFPDTEAHTYKCSNTLLALKDMIPYEQTNLRPSKLPLTYQKSWNNLQKCGRMCSCGNSLDAHFYWRETEMLCGNVIKEHIPYGGNSSALLSCTSKIRKSQNKISRDTQQVK